MRLERHERQQPLGDRLRPVLHSTAQTLLATAQPFPVPPRGRHEPIGPRRAHEPLDLDVLGHLAQGGLTQRGEVLDLEEVVQGRRHTLGGIDLAGPQPPDQRLGCQIDQHDLIGHRQHLVGNRLASDRPRQLPDLVVERLQVLNVDGREHIDPGLEHVTHILITLLVLDPGRVRVRKLVDQTQLGLALEHSRQIHLIQSRPSVENATTRNSLQPLPLSNGLGTPMRLEITDGDIPPVVSFGNPLLQHPVGLPDPGSHAYEYLEMAAFVRHPGDCERSGRSA